MRALFNARQGKKSQTRNQLLFHGLIRLWLRNSGLRPSDSLATDGSFRLMEWRNRFLQFAHVFPCHANKKAALRREQLIVSFLIMRG